MGATLYFRFSAGEIAGSLVVVWQRSVIWMERTGSSAQAITDPAVATEWLSIWQSLHPLLDGYYLGIARETILGLGGNDPSEGS